MRPTLTYFQIRGRAEPIRLLLHLCGVDYTDDYVQLERWGELKPKTPFGGLPIYREGDLVLPQAVAILYYLAEKHDLLGDTPERRNRARVTVEACRDVIADLGALIWSKDFDERRDAYVANVLPGRLACLEAFLEQNGDTAHWAGSGLTCADPYGWAALNALQPLAPQLLEQHPSLCAFKASFEARDDVTAYLDSPSRPPTYTLPIASFGGTPETSGR